LKLPQVGAEDGLAPVLKRHLSGQCPDGRMNEANVSISATWGTCRKSLIAVGESHELFSMKVTLAMAARRHRVLPAACLKGSWAISNEIVSNLW
jgi:hypothetical protein